MQRVFDPKTDPNQGRSALGEPPPADEPPVSPAQTAPYNVLNPPPAETQAQASPQASPQASGATPAANATPTKSAAADTGAPLTRSVAADRSVETAAKAAVAPAKAGIGDKASARFAMAGTAAAAAGKAKTLPDTALPPAASQKCRVWTASYGGQKSIIIRS